MDFNKICMRQGILLGNFLCDRVQGVERFAAHPRHFPSQVPPWDCNVMKFRLNERETVKPARKSRNHLLSMLLHKVISPNTRLVTHSLVWSSWFGSREEQINDMTGLFYAEHNKRHLSIT